MCPVSKITAFQLSVNASLNCGVETGMTRWFNWLEENSQLQDIPNCQNKKTTILVWLPSQPWGGREEGTEREQAREVSRKVTPRDVSVLVGPVFCRA